jgi:hypothetical protein
MCVWLCLDMLHKETLTGVSLSKFTMNVMVIAMKNDSLDISPAAWDRSIDNIPHAQTKVCQKYGAYFCFQRKEYTCCDLHRLATFLSQRLHCRRKSSLLTLKSVSLPGLFTSSSHFLPANKNTASTLSCTIDGLVLKMYDEKVRVQI